MIISFMKSFALRFLFVFAFFSSISYAEIVKDYKVTGNNRISKETIAIFGDIEINQDYNLEKINDLLKKLYDTNPNPMN